MHTHKHVVIEELDSDDEDEKLAVPSAAQEATRMAQEAASTVEACLCRGNEQASSAVERTKKIEEEFWCACSTCVQYPCAATG